MSTPAAEIAALVDARLADVLTQLAAWRDDLEAALGAAAVATPAALDEHVAALVVPALTTSDALLIGAGFIADSDVVGARGVHFAWWLGPLEAGPVLGPTTGPTRLEVSTRGYAEYLRDFRSLEWFRIPATTLSAHVTGPYVDHLCTCDYMLTVTAPVRPDPLGLVVGVVGADIAVQRLERELLPAMLPAAPPLAVTGAHGRVVVSTASTLPVGALAPADAPRVACATEPFAVVTVDESAP